ncbi:MAG: hypothetical protein QXJ17_07995 [Nitrososphaeria archaeon]
MKPCQVSIREYSTLEALSDYLGIFLIASVILASFEWLLISKISYIVYIEGFVTVVLSHLVFRRKIVYLPKEKSIVFYITCLFYLSILLTYLYAFPYFPLFPSADFKTHLQNALAFTEGMYSSSLPANPAVELLLSAWLSIGFDNPLFYTRLFIMLLNWSTIFHVYALGHKIGGRKVGEVASISYTLVSPFWYHTLIEAGLYANLLGIVIGLCFIRWFITMLEKQGIIRYFLIIVTSSVLILSHSSSILILAACIMAVIYLRFFEGEDLKLRLIALPIIGFLLVLLTMPSLIFRLPSALQGPYFMATTSDVILEFLKHAPFLSYIYAFNSISLVLFALITITFIQSVLNKRLGYYSIFYLWFFGAFGLSFFSSNAWRFALLSFIPMCVLSVKVFNDILLPIFSKIEAYMLNPQTRRLLKYQLICLVIIVLMFYSTADPLPAFRFASWSRDQQNNVYDAMLWFAQNTEQNACAVSISNSQFYFLPYIAHREFLGIFPSGHPDTVYSYLKDHRPGYVIVWNRLHPYNETWHYVDLYHDSPYFVEVWSNYEFTIFKVK